MIMNDSSVIYRKDDTDDNDDDVDGAIPSVVALLSSQRYAKSLKL